MDRELVLRSIQELAGGKNVKTDEPMKNHTSFKIGGPADILVTPESDEAISGIMKLCRRLEVPVMVIGNGSNLLVRDKGIRGVVVKLSDNYAACTAEGSTIRAQAGILLSRLANVALNHGLAGLEFASGIPGTLGGAVIMNAGAYGGEMKDVVVKTRCMDSEGDIFTLSGDQHMFAYRSSVLQSLKSIVLSSEIKLVEGEKNKIKAVMDDLNSRRKNSQPLEYPSAGSIFKRPPGYYTGPLIQECGLKGYQWGGAQVSVKHCGFIINTGDSVAEDVISVIRHVQEKVRDRFGVELETEVKIIGEE